MLKTIARRLLSLLLAVSIVLSMMTGMLLIVSAVGENAIRNWGVRDTVCTQLSSAAQSYYTGSNAYSTLKTLSGASSTANSLDAATNNDLYDALHTLMEDTHTTVDSISYSSHSSWYAYTDCENGDTSGKMKLLWAGGYRTWDGSYVNREHVWCKSHATYVETYGGADLHHLRPASAYVNQTPHNNRPYGSANAHGGVTCQDENGNFGGWVLHANDDWSQGQFEPPDNAKGDCARILLYVYTRWKQPNLYTSLDTSSSAYRNFVEETPSGTCDGVACIESLETLLKWCRDDPVDTWEMGRNDSVQSIQGNRNVFIDYPELAWYMFGQTPPANMTTPSGDAANGGVSYEITKATVNNNAYGSVSVTSSNTVTVFPAAGCYIVDATSTSGTVSINGNVITVNGMTADATVNVVLAQNATYTVSFSVPTGVTQTSISGFINSTITLPTPTGTPTANAQSYEFIGWTTGSVNDTTTLPTYYAAGDSYTITGNATLTALYRYNASTGTGSAAFDPNGTGGTYVLAANVDGTYYALPVSGLGTARPAGAEITVTNGAVSATDASGYEWTLTKDGTDFNISGGGQYLTWSSSTSLGASSDAYAWTIKANDTTTWKIIPSGASTRSLIFRAGSYNVFGGYAVTNLGNEYKAIEILPIGSGTVTQTHYTTDLQSTCDHTYGSAVSAGASGHTYTCTICRDSYTEPHTYTTSVSGLTTTYTCSVCGYRYQTTLDTYTISYNIRGTVSNTVDVTEGDSVTLPSATAYTGYTFCGWATAPITTDTETVPTVLTGSYTPTASITLYAVYSHVVQSADSGSSSYVLVTNTNQLVSGRNLIIAAKDYNYAMADVYNIYYRNQGAVTKSGSTLTPGSEVIPFTLGAGSTSGTWSLYDTKNKSYLSAYVSGIYYDLGAQGVIDANTSFTISVAGDGTASLTTNGGTCVVKYIKSTSYEEYKCVSASTTSNIYDIALYVETPGTSDATFYTTQPTIQCAHPNTTLTGAVAATCTAEGYTGDYVCDDCGVTVTSGSVTPVLGHSYSSAVTTAATCTADGVMTYTCSCGDSYTEPVAALGHDYGAFTSNSNGTHSKTCSRCSDVVTEDCSFTSVTSGLTTTYTCSVCSYSYQTTKDTYTVKYSDCGATSSEICIEGSSVTLPGGSDVDGYTFLGWVKAAIDPESRIEPEILTGSYEPTASATLYAVYSRSVDTVAPGTLTKMSAGDTLSSGDKIVIIAHDTDYIMHRSQKYTGYVDYAEGAGTISAATVDADPLCCWNVTVSEGAWIFGDTENGNLFTNGSNTLTFSTERKTTFTFTDNSNDTFYLKGDNRYLACRTDLTSAYKNYWRLGGTGGLGTYALDLYKYIPGPNTLVVWYTTNPDTGCDHENTEVRDAVAATCLNEGYTGDTWCIDCNAKVAEGTSIPALGHDYVNHAARAVTCTAIGWDAYQTCSRCDYTTYTEISALGHDIIADPAVAATCTVTGLTAGEHCSRCDYAVAQTETPELGHAWDDGVVTTAATIYSTGVMTYHCTRCDATKTEEIPRLTHTHYAYLTAAKAATCTAGGNSAYYYCYGCGKYFSDSECANEIETNSWVIPALGHDYVNGVCTRCGNKSLYIRSAALVLNGKIDIAFTAQLPSGYSSPKMTFTGPNGTVTVTEYTQTDGYYVFTYTGINPQCIGDNIAATLIATKNWSTEESVSIDNYSVRQYCVNKLADETISAELRTLLSDILAYGAAAQTYMDYKTNSPVNIGTDIINPTYSTYSDLSGLAPSFTGTADSSYYWLGAGLTLTNSVAMTFRFYAASTSGLQVKVTLNGTATTFSVSDFTAVDGKENTYEITLTGISAEDLDETVTAAIERYYSPIGNTLSYSVNTYIQSKQADSNENLAALVKALYNYGASVKAYATK